ncbi:hypothetical protein AYO44_02265 [Planctomycetaceae bacterium SCGC AG-212-F19]|nr:hypothetical protein AYO44_02265 [Planctomycetaceae bacterium SCGC AG-212-F19]
MAIFTFLRSRLGLTCLVVLILAALGGWLARDQILNWYYLERLSRAGAADRAAWAECVAQQDTAAIPGLLRRLASPSSGWCLNARCGLAAVAARWTPDDPRRSQLAVQLTESFLRLSTPGQRQVLELFADWLTNAGQVLPAETRDAAARLLPQGGRSSDKDVRAAALSLSGALLDQERRPEVVGCCREMVRQGFQDAEAPNRALAVRLAARPELNLLPQVAPLLDDPAPEVRKVAMIVVGPAPEAISTDDLLRSLHDTDEDVRRLCEAALRDWRGLRHEDVALGRLISDAHPGVRLQVVDNLGRARDLEPGVWLRRLSHDPAPAVRAAAIRAAGESNFDLSERVRQMAQNDPSPTVRQLADYYLSRHNSAARNTSDR